MKQELIEKFPDWYKTINTDSHYLVLSNDFDSYFSCGRLFKLFGLEIGGFYSFKSGLHINSDIAKNREPIFVDLSVSSGMSFDNHYTFVENPLSINPNVIKREYYKKYNGSTLALIMSLYGGVEKLNEERLTTLLCVDGFFIGYYKNYGRYRNVNLYWYDKLDMSDYVLPILENNNARYFENYCEEHRLKEEIRIDSDGLLTCNYNIELPKYRFKLEKPIKKLFTKKDKAIDIYNNDNNIFVSNEVFENEYILNLTI